MLDFLTPYHLGTKNSIETKIFLAIILQLQQLLKDMCIIGWRSQGALRGLSDSEPPIQKKNYFFSWKNWIEFVRKIENLNFVKKKFLTISL